MSITYIPEHLLSSSHSQAVPLLLSWGAWGCVDELHQGCLCHRSMDTLPAATALKKMLPHQLLSLCKSGDGGSTAEPLLVTGCWQTQSCPDPVLEITAAVSSGSWALHTSPLSSPALTFFPPLHLRCFLSLEWVFQLSLEPTISHHFSPKLWPIRNLHTLLTTAGRGFWDPNCWHSCTALCTPQSGAERTEFRRHIMTRVVFRWDTASWNRFSQGGLRFTL